MSTYDFQLTYSVSPCDSDNADDNRAAEKARRFLRDIDGWQSLEKIETTLVGKLYLSALTVAGRRSEAEEEVDTKVRGLLKEHDIFYDVSVYMSLMVDGLGEHIELQL